MAETASATRPARPRNRGARRVPVILFSVLGVIVVLGAIVFVTVTMGDVYGVEFSPDTFRRRSFFYYEIPLLHVQVWPIKRHDRTGQLERHLTKQKLIQQVNQAKPRWHLMSSNQFGTQPHHLDAHILGTYLDAFDAERNRHWLDWTTKNPKLAQVLWPAVAKVARQGMYFFIPDMMELARSADTPAELQTRLAAVLARRYGELATAGQQLGEHETAVKHFTEALSYDSGDAELLRARAKSLTALGETEKATADLRAAEAN